VIKAKKSLGQNFLIDQNIINKITNLIEIRNKCILEVGPGTGNLTSSILKKNPKKVYVVEKDNNLALRLNKEFENQIIIINDDILKINEKLICNQELIVFGNLPYNISTEILCKWILNLDNKKIWFTNLILMFQKEVADRIISKYNNSNYGRLSILANWKLKVKKIIDIKPNSFSPSPKIDSSLLFFSLKENFLDLENPYNLEKITRIFFNHRRKMIKKPYFSLFPDDNVSKKLKLDLKLRPQNLDYDVYYNLANEYEKLRS
tara:strand:- start:874 stop:1659 length:786 start_codon:yes stop_codon:yes gene_type:complete